MTRVRVTLMAGALCAALAAAGPAAAETKKMVVAAPGIPPIFASVILYVAEKEGLFKKYGANVEVRPFETGTAASRAVIAGDIEMSLSPSALLINQISNTDADTVAIYGLTNTDFLLATTDPAKTSCKDVVGQPVGVDTVGGARSIRSEEHTSELQSRENLVCRLLLEKKKKKKKKLHINKKKKNKKKK